MSNELFDDIPFSDLFLPEPQPTMITPAEEEIIRILPTELKAINARIEHLERALNMQTLKLGVERPKRQKLRLALRLPQNENPTFQLEALRQSIEANMVYQNTVNYQISGDVDKLSTLMFRCLSRTQQIMSLILPCIPITPSDHPDVNILIEEIGRTLQQLCAPHQTTTYI